MLENLSGFGRFLAEYVAGQMQEEPDPVRLSGMAERFGRQLPVRQTRIIILNRDGIVVGDSVRVGGFLGQSLDRPEVHAALSGNIESSIQTAEQTNQKVAQVAVPVRYENVVIGAVFISTYLDEIEGLLAEVRSLLLITTLVAMAVVGGGSIILARRLTGPLEVLTRATAQIAEGKFDQQIPVYSRDEIGQLAHQFNLMAARLNYYTRNLQNFASNVSHELRTPLASLSLLAKSLKEYEMDPEQRQEFLEDLDRELDRLIALVNDLLELTRLEQKNQQQQAVDLKEVLQEAIEQIQPRFKSSGVQLLSVLPDSPAVVYGSSVQLRQAIDNILDNALKHTSPDGRVRVALDVGGDEALVTIADSGCGIPEEDLPHIFERFYRVDRARSRDMGGTGLGLAIAREIATAHNGRIWAESTPGEGSIFSLSIPFLRRPFINNN